MRRNRLSRPLGKNPRDAAASDSRRSQGRQLTFQSLEDRCLLDGSNPVETGISVHKDDGSIPLATDTTAVLVSGAAVDAVSNIGTGPYGTTTGDFDFYKVFVNSDQMLTIQINNGTSLQSIVGVFDAQGDFLDGQVDQLTQQESYLHFTPSTGGDYYVAVGQYLSGEVVSGSLGATAFPADPTNSASGPGSYHATQGSYKITLSLASYTPVAPGRGQRFGDDQ